MIGVDVDRSRIALSDHSRQRYEQRVRRHDWRALDVGEIPECGQLRRPSAAQQARYPDVVAELVHRGAVFPLTRRPDGSFVAKTCLARWKPPGEDRRARREAEREDHDALGGLT